LSLFLLNIISFNSKKDHLKLSEEKNSEYENEYGEKYTLRRLTEEESILKEPIIIGIFSCFCAFSANAGLESSITLLTKWLLGWDQVENAIIFVTAGLGAILSYGIVTLISTKKILDDRQILLGSCCLCFCNLCFIGTVLSVFEFGAKWLVPAMISGTFFLVISLPPMLTSAAVIIAKNTPNKDQAFVLSLRTTAERTTQMIFSTWYTSMAWMTTNYHFGFPMLAGSLLCLAINVTLILLSWKYLKAELIQPFSRQRLLSVR